MYKKGKNMGRNKFSLGKVFQSSGINEFINESPLNELYVFSCLYRHVEGDWGDLDIEDKETNENALINGGRLFSSYQSGKQPKIWIITEWDRSTTTILFPSEY